MKHFFITAIIFFSVAATAQELNCNVQVNSDQVQGTNKQVFNALQQAVADFVNNSRWTDLPYSASERIDCNISIIVKAVEGNDFTAEIVVQSRRPVYNTSYSSPVLNLRDKNLNFTFSEFERLENVSGTLTSNLTAVLSYYAYIIIGYDMDSFSPAGGTPCFQQAENIVNMAQSSDWAGWRAFEDSRNRYAIISNLMDEQFAAFRNYIYQYHRLGLDVMADNPTNGRAKIASGLPIVRTTNRARPQAVVITIFTDTKMDELINVFKGGTDKEKQQAIEILSDVNPTQSARYETILD
ncbi:MAG: DUF4835 family protein [Prevotellaceae bacterium]|jgi:hypothetical protein|nr:DUF4835 family protein [Prevotellaceae bacterium]